MVPVYTKTMTDRNNLMYRCKGQRPVAVGLSISGGVDVLQISLEIGPVLTGSLQVKVLQLCDSKCFARI